MSKFEKFVNSLENACDKAVKGTAKATDIVASKVKLKAEEARLCDKYEALGRAAEASLRSMNEIPEQIATALDEINKVKEKIKTLEKDIKHKNQKS